MPTPIYVWIHLITFLYLIVLEQEINLSNDFLLVSIYLFLQVEKKIQKGGCNSKTQRKNWNLGKRILFKKFMTKQNTSYSSTFVISIFSPFVSWGRFFSLTANHGMIDVNPFTVTRCPVQWNNSPPTENSIFVLQHIIA